MQSLGVSADTTRYWRYLSIVVRDSTLQILLVWNWPLYSHGGQSSIFSFFLYRLLVSRREFYSEQNSIGGGFCGPGEFHILGATVYVPNLSQPQPTSANLSNSA